MNQDHNMDPSQDTSVTSSNLVEIKQLQSMLKYATRQLQSISDSAADAWQEMLKLQKVLKPKTCPCDCNCTCKACNDLDSCLWDVQEIVQAINFNNHISAIENYFGELHSAYARYIAAHSQEWDIWQNLVNICIWTHLHQDMLFMHQKSINLQVLYHH